LTRAEILRTCKKEGVRFLRLQFTDIHGANKNVEIPATQFEKALDGEIMFDGSSIEGFTRIEESDMLLHPEYSTFRIFPWEDEDHGRVARLVCDVKQPDGGDFEGDPRTCLKRITGRAKKLGYTMMVGPEAEFFLFHLDPEGKPSTRTHDAGAYFDLAPIDKGEECRRSIVMALEAMGFEVEAAHHEVSHGQHEIDFRYADALNTADNLATFRFLVRHIARDYDLHATFMPKPIFGQNGNGMHCHQSLFRGRTNAFYDPKKEYELSVVAMQYIAGLLEHSPGFVAVTNPIVNSYKRLVPGYEAPTNVAWSMRNRSPMVRIPERRGAGTRCEVRLPDPSCNPYLAFAVMLASGLDGIKQKLVPPPPVNKNIFTMSQREKRRFKIEDLPTNLEEALNAMEKDPVILEAMGEHLAEAYIAGKRQHWNDFMAAVHPWELQQYLSTY
jgi:glutamine synthetase